MKGFFYYKIFNFRFTEIGIKGIEKHSMTLMSMNITTLSDNYMIN